MFQKLAGLGRVIQYQLMDSTTRISSLSRRSPRDVLRLILMSAPNASRL